MFQNRLLFSLFFLNYHFLSKLYNNWSLMTLTSPTDITASWMLLTREPLHFNDSILLAGFRDVQNGMPSSGILLQQYKLIKIQYVLDVYYIYISSIRIFTATNYSTLQLVCICMVSISNSRSVGHKCSKNLYNNFAPFHIIYSEL